MGDRLTECDTPAGSKNPFIPPKRRPLGQFYIPTHKMFPQALARSKPFKLASLPDICHALPVLKIIVHVSAEHL